MASGIQAISFDVGGTLIEPWPSVGDVYAEVATESGYPCPDPQRITRQFVQAWQGRKSFGYTRQDWAEVVEKSFEGVLPSQVASRLFPLIYDRFTEARSWHLYPDVLPTLERLRAQGLRMAITSNWDERLDATLRALNLQDYFEVVTASGPLGYHKPTAAIFHATCEALQLQPKQVLHVGDSRSEDFGGSTDAGLQGLLLRRQHVAALEPHEINSLLGLRTSPTSFR
ncbi:MAG: HAD-IA family hydrolase [Verrucomicrobiales bacterium]|nr:HAD-IA family hydrolase [Verrucomicrobiales bacterium]